MSLRTSARRWSLRVGTAALTAAALGVSFQLTVGASAATRPVNPARSSLLMRMYSLQDPYNPAHGHTYRYGVFPTRHRLAMMRKWAISHPHAVPAASSNDLAFGGGIDGIGVTTGHEKVYLVFWGSQWGTQGTNSNGDVTLSGDPDGMAPYLQELMKGLGSGGELWSGVMTQYCQGVSTGATSCPSSNQYHVAYPTGGALSGVWVDESSSAPAAATAAQLGTEAVNAAGHFGNTTAASNRDAQYVVISPTGTDPDSYQQQGFCAWHDWNGDSYVGVSSPYGDIAFTNLPYIPDAGTSCGMNYVNSGSAGTLDGASIVEGHEYAETITDQNPAGGWTNSSGYETGDLCAWDQGGGAVSQDVNFTTGSFAMQPTWANDGGGTCEISHSIVTNGGSTGNTVTVNSPGSQTGTVGTATSLQLSATDSQSGQTFTWSATGLPSGLSINSSTGLISGTPTTAAAYSVTATATDTTGASGSASFTWTIGSSGSTNVIVNGGFEDGNLTGWTSSGSTAVTTTNPHSGNYAGLTGIPGTETSGNSTLKQSFTAPSGSSKVSFWYNVDCNDSVQYDYATATLKNNTTGTTSTVLAHTCNTNNTWVQVSASITAGDSYTITLINHDDGYSIPDPTSTEWDDVLTS